MTNLKAIKAIAFDADDTLWDNETYFLEVEKDMCTLLAEYGDEQAISKSLFATEMANMTEYVFGWDATSDIIEKWMYDGIAEKYLLDEKVKEWMLEVNPHAMKEMLDRLHEAIDRGMWDADDEMKERLKDLYLELEDRLEEISDK